MTNLTTCSPLPKNIVRWGRCYFLHETARIMIGNEIKDICITCTKEAMKHEKKKTATHKDKKQDVALVKKMVKKEDLKKK